MYEVRLHREAERSFRKLHEPLRARVVAAIDALAVEPRPAGATRLAGRDDYRIRVGDHRIVYAIDDATATVVIARISHRREVYRR